MTEEDAHKRHTVLELTPAGHLSHFAGAKPDCGCTDLEDCTCPAEERVGICLNRWWWYGVNIVYMAQSINVSASNQKTDDFV